jgi:hypothetical protein
MPTNLLIVLCEAVIFNFMLCYLYDVLSDENGFWISVNIIILYAFLLSFTAIFSIVITHFRFSNISEADVQGSQW